MADIGGARDERGLPETFRFVDAQLDRGNAALLSTPESLDTKATVIAGLAAAAVSVRLLTPTFGSMRVTALALYALCLLMALACLWPRRRYGLRPAELLEIGEASPAVVIGRVAATKAEIFSGNHRQSRRKALLWTVAVVLLLLATTVAVIDVLVGRAA